MRKKVTNIFKDRVVYLKRLFKELMPDLLCFVYCIYHMLIFFNIKLYRYVLATRKVFRRMAKHRWQHKCPLDFPYLMIFKLRISFILVFVFLLESFQIIVLYFCAGELYYRKKNDFYVLNRKRNSYRTPYEL